MPHGHNFRNIAENGNHFIRRPARALFPRPDPLEGEEPWNANWFETFDEDYVWRGDGAALDDEGAADQAANQATDVLNAHLTQYNGFTSEGLRKACAAETTEQQQARGNHNTRDATKG
ncbi:hypothetical protein HBH47_072620 [Parastagonospora nodorum]|nr:hypothetical protein HBH47_072620 [Parastagonospora nodorum]